MDTKNTLTNSKLTRDFRSISWNNQILLNVAKLLTNVI